MLWHPALAGLAFALVFGWIGFLTGLRRFALLALLTAGLGTALGILGIGYWTGVAVLATCVGGILLLYGIRGLRDYLHRISSSTG